MRTPRIIVILLSLMWIGSLTIPTGCKSDDEMDEEISLDSAVQRWIRENDFNTSSQKLQLVRFGKRDTFTRKHAIEYGLDSLDDFLVSKDSVLAKADEYEKDANIIQEFMPHDLDAQYMKILAGKMRLKVLDYERIRDSLQRELETVDPAEILVIRVDAQYRLSDAPTTYDKPIDCFVTLDPDGKVVFFGFKNDFVIF
ncbi:MAG: hypothetical protein H6608_09965 [Flavobacteriales bacterium]|nr:hypothetical protein [Bacteroidota bacterium]MCB9241448.1 hypothetical protein [Flavobacteriales bacterium]